MSVDQGGAAPTCTYSVAPVAQSATAGGGAGTPIQVSTTSGCAWTATSNVPWLTIRRGSKRHRQRSGDLHRGREYRRRAVGSLTIAGQTATVTQSAAPTSPPCTYSVSPTHDSIGANGGTGTTIVVSSPDGCSWNASTDSPWIAIVSGAVGSGNGSVVYVASPNSGARRSGTVIAGDKPVVIDQAAAPCDYAIAPTSQNIGASGGAGTAVSVTARADCTWTASSEASWLTITSGASGTGNGSVQFTAAANTGGARSGDLVIAGRRSSVAQAAAPPPLHVFNRSRERDDRRDRRRRNRDHRDDGCRVHLDRDEHSDVADDHQRRQRHRRRHSWLFGRGQHRRSADGRSDGCRAHVHRDAVGRAAAAVHLLDRTRQHDDCGVRWRRVTGDRDNGRWMHVDGDEQCAVAHRHGGASGTGGGYGLPIAQPRTLARSVPAR